MDLSPSSRAHLRDLRRTVRAYEGECRRYRHPLPRHRKFVAPPDTVYELRIATKPVHIRIGDCLVTSKLMCQKRGIGEPYSETGTSSTNSEFQVDEQCKGDIDLRSSVSHLEEKCPSERRTTGAAEKRGNKCWHKVLQRGNSSCRNCGRSPLPNRQRSSMIANTSCMVLESSRPEELLIQAHWRADAAIILYDLVNDEHDQLGRYHCHSD